MELMDYRSTGHSADPANGRALLRRERDDAVRGVDVDREAVEEVASEEAVAGARDVVGRDLHAPHARLTDLQRVDDDERDLVGARDARDARRADGARDRGAG